jgi:hypothetical protein
MRTSAPIARQTIEHIESIKLGEHINFSNFVKR